VMFRLASDNKDCQKEEVLLHTSDDRYIATNPQILQQSTVLKQILEDAPQDDGGITILPCADISSPILMLIMQWLDHYSQPGLQPPKIERPLRTPLTQILSDFDKSFVYGRLILNDDEKQNENLLKVINGAYFLNIQPLRDLGCAALADIIKTKSSEEEMRALFGVKEPFTEEDWKRLEADLPWLKEDPTPSSPFSPHVAFQPQP